MGFGCRTRSFRHRIVAFVCGTVVARRTEQESEIAFLVTPRRFASSFVLELGKEEEKVFDPSSLAADRCESCYGAESEDVREPLHLFVSS